MKPGGTFNTRVFQNDLNEIQSGQPPSAMLLRLPLLTTFIQSSIAPNSGSMPYGGRPDLRTDTGANPIVGNLAGGQGITPTRIVLNQPCNCLQLLWHALDSAGNYVCSYPINDPGNVNLPGNTVPYCWSFPNTSPSSAAPFGYWAFGWVRLNGLGPWLSMSLLPSNAWMQPPESITGGGLLGVLPFGGFSSITAPMSFIDWIGYWDGFGKTGGPNGTANLWILAMASANMAFASNGVSLGSVDNYATPSGSGPEQQPQNADTLRSQDVLVPVGRNGR